MNNNTRGTAAAVIGIVVVALATGYWLLTREPMAPTKSTPPPIPATVPKPFVEEQAATLRLTPEAEIRLAIQTGLVERKPTPRVRVYGGEVLIPPGRTILVAAPMTGVLAAPANGVPIPGQVVTKGQPVLSLRPLLTPDARATLGASRVDAEGQVNTAQAQVELAKIALDRATRLLKSEAGSQRTVDEARAGFDVAERTLTAATTRRDLLARVTGEVDGGTTGPIPLDAPVAGVLRAVSAQPGQTVPAGAALFDIIDPARIWVRVPVYVGDLPALDSEAAAAIGPLTARPGNFTLPAIPVSAPPSANPLTGTADLFFELDNRQTRYSPGHRVAATIALKEPAVSLTVPWAAVVHDVQGGTWVYEPMGNGAFARRRVIVRYVTGDTAVLADGPPAGTKVVVAGAAELFGTEAGFSK